jgi:hypothetical protein
MISFDIGTAAAESSSMIKLVLNFDYIKGAEARLSDILA